MSQENVEIVSKAFLAAGSGDPGAAQGLIDQSIERRRRASS
jgi:hypothetical protein